MGHAERSKRNWRQTGCGVLAALLAGPLMAGVAPAAAADLDRPYYRPPRPYAGCLPVPPSCRLVPLPQMDLYNEVTRYGVQRVCISRGVYADSMWPYAPPYWRPNRRQGYAAEP